MHVSGRSISIVVAVVVLVATGCGSGGEAGPAAETAASTSTVAPTTTTSERAPVSSTTSTPLSSTTSTLSTTTQAPPTAEELYQAHCAACHGVELEGGVGPALGAGGHAHGHTDAELIDWITNGKGTMPAFGEKLSSEQIEVVLAYVLAADSAGS